MKISRAFRTVLVTVLAASTGLAATACSSGGAAPASSENSESGSIWDHYNTVQPLLEPTGKSVYRDTLTFAEATHILGLNTYTFFLRKGGNGGPMFECPSMGSAVPNTGQLSNPDFVEPDPNASAGSVTIGNMDPDGVYPPGSSSGTYVRCLLADGKSYLAYSEPDIVQLNVTGAMWDPKAYDGQGGIVVTGAPVMPVCQVRWITQSTSSQQSQGSPSADQSSTQEVPVTNCKPPSSTSSSSKVACLLPVSRPCRVAGRRDG